MIEFMDWNSETTRDFTEFAHEVVHNVDAVDGSSNFGGTRTKRNFSVDLKLGQVNNSAYNSLHKLKETGITKMQSFPSGSSKRARAATNGSHTVSCLVDGCDADLSNCRDYHRRHKVCELHSKTPQVMVGGQKQRFCQQCSRFHSLEEFDDGKRSCRKRLDGHNRRRRKPQPDPLSHAGGILSNYQGAQLLTFSSSHMYSSATVVSPTWAGVANTEADARHYNQHQHLNLPDKQNLFLGSSPKGGKAFTFLQGDNPTHHHQTSTNASVSMSQCLLWTAVLSETSGGSHNTYHDRSTTRDLDCALSLLSSPPTQSQTSGISLSHMVQSLGTSLHNHCTEPMESVLVSSGCNANCSTEPLVQSLGTSLHNHSIEPMESVLVSSGRNANVNCPRMFHLGSNVSAANDVPQTIPFQW